VAPDGTVYVFFTEIVRSGAATVSTLRLLRSTDRGDTWSAPVVVNRNTTVSAFTPTVAVRSDGRIGVTYFDMRDERAGDARLDVGYWIVTSADGSSWSETRVADPFDLALAPVARGLFIGDYMGLATSGTSFVPLYARTNDNSPQNRTDIHAVPVGRLTAAYEPTGAQLLARPAHLATPTAAEQRRSYAAIMRTLEQRIPDWRRRQAAFEAAAARR
jgi:hypothetical protein